MPEAAMPGLIDLGEADTQKVRFTMKLPVATRVGMTIESKKKGADWTDEPFQHPLLRPTVAGKLDPSRGPFEQCLCVSSTHYYSSLAHPQQQSHY